MFYSKSTGGFYDAEIHGNNIPSDAVEITKEKYPDFNVFHTAISNYDGTTTFCSVLSEDPDYVGSSSIYNKKFKRRR